MLNRTYLMLSANTNRLNLGTRALADLASVIIGVSTLRSVVFLCIARCCRQAYRGHATD